MVSDLRRLRLRLAVAGLLLANAHAVAQPIPESDMKAAFVFNFAVFTEWPPEVLAFGAPLRVCADGAAPYYPALLRMADKLVNGHRLSVQRLAGANLRHCHVLVLGSAERERWSQMRRDLAGAHVLTVTDDSVIGADGAVIGMTVENQHIGFDVDLAAARGARLVLSSKLLRLARSIQ
jgi:hypothetical protein